MTSPALVLQKAVYDALSGYAGLIAEIGAGHIYDAVPESAEPPYVVIGEDQIIDDGNGCSDGWEIYSTIHVWAQPHGRAKAKRIGSEVCTALAQPLSVQGFIVVVQQLESERYMIDADGVTPHGIITQRYKIRE